jgi:tetratricopeptide (TPR) repeat protein
MPAFDPRALVGRTFGPYAVLEELGRGGQGAVLRARHPRVPGDVALKLLIEDAGQLDLARFQREARLLRELDDHPGVLRLYDHGELKGIPYLACELIDGQTLAQRVAQRGRPAWEWSALVVAQLADALEYCHQRGVLHRDVKAQNVLLRAGDESPVLVDFGLARRTPASLAASLEAITRTGEVLGTPSCMAPEQVSPELGQVGPATDVYGLGALLYLLLTGRPPFQAPALIHVLQQVLEVQPKPPRELAPDVPPGLERVCLRALAKLPAERPSSAAALAAELRAVVESGGQVGARPRLALAAGALAVLTLGAVGAGLAWTRSGPVQPASGEGRVAESEPPPRQPQADPEPPPTPPPPPPLAPDRPQVDDPQARALAARARHREAAALAGEGHMEAAVAVLREVIRDAPDWAEGYLSLSEALASLGDHAGALEAANQAVRVDPADPIPWQGVGVLRMLGGELEGGVAAFDRSLELDPSRPTPYSWRAIARVDLGDPDGGLRDLGVFLLLADRFSAESQAGVARCQQMVRDLGPVRLREQIRTGQWVMGAWSAALLLEADPEHLEAQAAWVRCLMELEEFDRAERGLRGLVSATNLSSEQGRMAREGLGVALAVLGNDEEAEPILASLRGDPAQVYDGDARLAEIFLRSGRVAEALELLEELLRRDPANRLGRYVRGLALACAGRLSAALEDLTWAAEEPAPPQGSPARARQDVVLATRLRDGLGEGEAAGSRFLRCLQAAREAEVLVALGRSEDALTLLAGLQAEAEPCHIELRLLRARITSRLGRAEEAWRLVEQALADDPGAAWAMNARGELLMARGEWADAAVWLKRGLQAGARGAGRLHFALAECLARLGDIDGALEQAEQALSAEPLNPVARLFRAQVCLQAGRVAGALERARLHRIARDDLVLLLRVAPEHPCVPIAWEVLEALNREH